MRYHLLLLLLPLFCATASAQQPDNDSIPLRYRTMQMATAVGFVGSLSPPGLGFEFRLTVPLGIRPPLRLGFGMAGWYGENEQGYDRKHYTGMIDLAWYISRFSGRNGGWYAKGGATYTVVTESYGPSIDEGFSAILGTGLQLGIGKGTDFYMEGRQHLGTITRLDIVLGFMM